jgi:hypothetical protein
MRTETAVLDSEAGALAHARRFARNAFRAWRGITVRQWAWTACIALVILLANTAALLPPLLNAVPMLTGRQTKAVSVAGFAGGAAVVFVAAICFLLAVRIAEDGTSQRRARRYVAAGLAAWGVAVLLEIGLYVFIPSVAPTKGGMPLLLDGDHLLGRIMWSAANIGLSGGLALAVYVRFQSARLAREAFNAAERDRVAASREVLASRLAAIQARIEPAFLLGTLGQVETLYDHDSIAGDRMLDGLIAYLHAALPQLRSQRSTLKQEARLVDSYLRIMQIRMGSRLEYRFDVAPELDECDFPPMVLLPLIDDALRNGLEPLPLGGTIVLGAHAGDGRTRVHIADDGLPRADSANDALVTATLRERLHGLYGNAARLELTANLPQGTLATIEVPS